MCFLFNNLKYMVNPILIRRKQVYYPFTNSAYILELAMFETEPISALTGKLQDGAGLGQHPIHSTLLPKLRHK
jgi:hypothetical protein